MFVVGIDPGLHGGISGINFDTRVLWSIETPLQILDPETKKIDYDIPRIASLLRASNPDLVYMENVHSMPKQGVSSTFLFGKGFGILLGVIGTLGYPLKLVTPRVWKSKLGITADKETARLKADELFPACSAFWKLKKHDGLAEAALLAYYGAGEVDLDLIVPGDISELYSIEVNKGVKASSNSRRNHNSASKSKNRRSRDGKDKRNGSSASRSGTVGT